MSSFPSGGRLAADVLEAHGVHRLFFLCGGHISPVIVEAKKLGIEVIDTRHEATAVFAADATARLGGVPGVAAVTAGPGLSNSITPLRNALMAGSPLVLIVGATATALKGRGSLQDIDQLEMVRSNVKWAAAATSRGEIQPLLNEAFKRSLDGVPGPVMVELPVDLLYSEAVTRDWYQASMPKGKGLGNAAVRWYLQRHLNKIFDAPPKQHAPVRRRRKAVSARKVGKVAGWLEQAKRPVLVVGSQTLVDAAQADEVAEAVKNLGMPTYLTGMARGLLGSSSPAQLKHRRRNALKEADLVIFCGMPFDFRCDYGRQINRKAKLVAVNLDRAQARKNRRPTLLIEADSGDFLIALAAAGVTARNAWTDWREYLRSSDREREDEIEVQAKYRPESFINPLHLLKRVEAVLDEDSILVGDGGDFVATASYVLKPRGPLCWLDPGVFGTLGVGAGFTLAAAKARPEAEIWLLWGDGSAGYGLSEIDTFVRHGAGCIALVGNDASWAQIAREQVEILGDAVGTELEHSAYHEVATAFGGIGLEIRTADQIDEVLAEAKRHAAAGRAVLVNAHLAKTDFRKGSISI